ncbi:MAG: creatininase family protein [Candidatus Eiseniibacteriota bacterium]
MSKPTSRYWQELTTEDFAALDGERAVALLPVAAIEQHGPHLPVAVDAAINAALVERLVARAPARLALLVLPMVAVGVSPEHADFPGTLTLSPETMLRVLSEIGDSVAAAGIRRLVFLNSHGGQPQLLDLAIQGLRRRHRMLAVAANAWRFWNAEGLFPAAELRHGIHGGAVETSIMLHIRPDLVRREAIANFASLSAELEGRFGRLTPFGRVGFGWQTQDLNPEGACGDATLATAEHGAALLDQATAALIELLDEVARLPLEVMRSR